jgi:hypothetical protein
MKTMVLKIWRIIPKISKVGVSNLFTLKKGNIFQNMLEMTKKLLEKKKNKTKHYLSLH